MLSDTCYMHCYVMKLQRDASEPPTNPEVDHFARPVTQAARIASEGHMQGSLCFNGLKYQSCQTKSSIPRQLAARKHGQASLELSTMCFELNADTKPQQP